MEIPASQTPSGHKFEVNLLRHTPSVILYVILPDQDSTAISGYLQDASYREAQLQAVRRPLTKPQKESIGLLNTDLSCVAIQIRISSFTQ